MSPRRFSARVQTTVSSGIRQAITVAGPETREHDAVALAHLQSILAVARAGVSEVHPGKHAAL